MAYSKLKNSAGQFVEPNKESFQAAAAGADWAKANQFFLIMTNSGGKKSWPIAGSTFVLIPKVQKTPEQVATALKFFKWVRGQSKMADELHYIAIPKSVDGLVDKTWKEIKTEDGKQVSVGI
jgi:phosphate transport system substrate-binding protein